MKTKFVRKTYVQPQTVAVEMEIQKMVCASDMDNPSRQIDLYEDEN